MMRSRSCWNAGRTSSSTSGRNRPLDRALRAACGASIESSRASSDSRMLDTNGLQEAGAVGQRPDAEIVGDGLSEIGKRLASADVDAAPDARAGQQHRDV